MRQGKLMPKGVQPALLAAMLLVSVSVSPLLAQTDINELYVINSLAETLDKIDLISGTVQHNVAVLGLYPNRVWVNDTMAVVVNSGDADLQLIRLADFTNLGFVYFNENDNPYDLAVVGDTAAYVTLFGSHEVAYCNLKTRAVVSRAAVGYHPEGVLVSGDRVYVVNTAFDDIEYKFAQGTLYVLDRLTLSVIDSAYTSRNPQTLITIPDGTIHIVCTGNYTDEFGRVDVFDPRTSSVVDHIDIGGSPGIAHLDHRSHVYLAEWGWGQGRVYTYGALTRQVINGSANPILPGNECAYIIGDRSDNLYVCEFNIDDVIEYGPDDLPTGRSFGVGDGPAAAALRTNRIPGDTNDDGRVNPVDVVIVVNHVYKSWPIPGRPSAADVDHNCVINPVDVVIMVNRVYRGWGALLWGCVL